jgi:hypothetical protein
MSHGRTRQAGVTSGARRYPESKVSTRYDQ